MSPSESNGEQCAIMPKLEGRMDLRQLRYFIAIVECGSFSRAAEVLRVAQPALSLHVRNMEAELCTSLLFRSPKGVLPTETGAILLQRAKIILEQFALIENEIRGRESDPVGVVRLGLPGTISQILAVPLITAVRKQYPKIKLRISDAMSGFVMEWMRTGQIDLAVLYDETCDQGMQATRILAEQLVLFGPMHLDIDDLHPRAESIPFERVAALPLILPGEGHALRNQLSRVAITSGVALETTVDVDSYSNIKKLVLNGFGFSVLPQNAVADEVASGQLRSWRICDPELMRSVYLYHAGAKPMTNAVAAVRALAIRSLTQLVEDGDWIGAQVTRDSDSKLLT